MKIVAVFVALAALAAVCTAQELWPMPTSVSSTGNVLSISTLEFSFNSVGVSSDVLTQAIGRYGPLTFPNTASNGLTRKMTFTGGRYAHGVKADASLTELNIDVLTNNMTLGLDTDESYTLKVTSPTASLTANTVFGALHGLETFSQLVWLNTGNMYFANETTITDAPRFHHRGILIDTSRHYLPLAAIYENLDAMAYNKMSVLHWHIVDEQSFPFVSKAWPLLAAKGAYNNVTHTYTHADVNAVIQYAFYRGIRVVPEFDTPGHTTCWGNGYPELLTTCYEDGVVQEGVVGPVNPITNFTYDFITALYEEVAGLWIDDYIHIGGDEVSFSCWESNPDIQAFMAAKGWTDYSLLEQFYEQNVVDIMAQKTGRIPMVWQDVFDNGVKIQAETVVEVWREPWASETLAVTKAGYRAVVSSPWYENYISYGATWETYYAVDIGDFGGTPAEVDLVMGGEACVWGEYVDATNLISRLWPFTGAIAERLWSASDVNNVTEAEPRLHVQRCRMVQRGIRAEPANGPGFCVNEWNEVYSPLYEV